MLCKVYREIGWNNKSGGKQIISADWIKKVDIGIARCYSKFSKS
jgi:hypothetical protein